jgi:hypothetical protein
MEQKSSSKFFKRHKIAVQISKWNKNLAVRAPFPITSDLSRDCASSSPRHMQPRLLHTVVITLYHLLIITPVVKLSAAVAPV